MGSECRRAEGQEETVWWLRAEEAVRGECRSGTTCGAGRDSVMSDAFVRRVSPTGTQPINDCLSLPRCHRDGGASPLDDASVRCVASTLIQENAPANLLFFAWLFSGLYGYIYLC